MSFAELTPKNQRSTWTRRSRRWCSTKSSRGKFRRWRRALGQTQVGVLHWKLDCEPTLRLQVSAISPRPLQPTRSHPAKRKGMIPRDISNHTRWLSLKWSWSSDNFLTCEMRTRVPSWLMGATALAYWRGKNIFHFYSSSHTFISCIGNFPADPAGTEDWFSRKEIKFYLDDSTPWET